MKDKSIWLCLDYDFNMFSEFLSVWKCCIENNFNFWTSVNFCSTWYTLWNWRTGIIPFFWAACMSVSTPIKIDEIGVILQYYVYTPLFYIMLYPKYFFSKKLKRFCLSFLNAFSLICLTLSLVKFVIMAISFKSFSLESIP